MSKQEEFKSCPFCGQGKYNLADGPVYHSKGCALEHIDDRDLEIITPKKWNTRPDSKDGLAKRIRKKLETPYEQRPSSLEGWIFNLKELLRECIAALYQASGSGDKYEKYQPCGCVLCTCEDEIHCRGCGAKSCGNHPVSDASGFIKTAKPKAEDGDSVLVPVVDCPDPECGNQGFYVQPDSRGEPEQVQCEFCYTTPNSRFNVEAIKALGGGND